MLGKTVAYRGKGYRLVSVEPGTARLKDEKGNEVSVRTRDVVSITDKEIAQEWENAPTISLEERPIALEDIKPVKPKVKVCYTKRAFNDGLTNRQQQGVFIGYSRDRKLVRVRWDGGKVIHNLHPSFVARVTETEKVVATAEERQAIDFTKIYHITVLKPLKTGDVIVFDTERKSLVKRVNVGA